MDRREQLSWKEGEIRGLGTGMGAGREDYEIQVLENKSVEFQPMRNDLLENGH